MEGVGAARVDAGHAPGARVGLEQSKHGGYNGAVGSSERSPCEAVAGRCHLC